MAKQNGSRALSLIAWFTGVVVSLAVGFGLVDEILTVPYIPAVVTVVVGWIVVVTTLVSVVLAIIKN